jgi:Holliday junction resolvase
MSKRKGSRAERELLHMFWNTNIWAALRLPGSGSTPLPSPDIIASNKAKILAIECKSIKKTTKYLEKEKIQQLKEFSSKFGAEPWLAIRFDNIGWYFLQPHKIDKSRNGNPLISIKTAQKKGLRFEELIGEFNQIKLK